MSDELDTESAVQSYLQQVRSPAQPMRASMTMAAGSNADQEAEFRRLSRESGLPVDTVRNDPATVKASVSAPDYDDFATRFPQTAAYLSNLPNAQVAHDDTHALSGVERGIRALFGGRSTGWAAQKPDPAVASGNEFSRLIQNRMARSAGLDAYDAIKAQAGITQVDNGPLAGPVRGTDTSIGSIVRGFMQAAADMGPKFKANMQGQIADLLGDEATATQARNRARAIDTMAKSTTPEFQTMTAEGLYGGGVSFINNSPGVLMSVLSGSPVPGLAMAGVQTEADAFNKYRERGGTVGEALTGGLLEGGIEVATEALPMGFFVKKLGRTGMSQFITGMLAREIPGEQVATLAQDAVDTAIANPNKTWGEYVAERPEAAYKTLLATLVQAGTMGAVHKVGQTITRFDGSAERAEQAAAEAQELIKMAEASKLRTRDASSFKDFVQQVAEDNGGEAPAEFFIDAEQLRNALNQSGISTDRLALIAPEVAAQLEASGFVPGADIRIPAAEFAAAGSDITTPLVQHLRESPEAMSQAEAQQYLTEQGARIQSEVEAELALGGSRAQREADVAKATTMFQTELEAAGRFRPEVNKAYASLLGNFYATQAARAGVPLADFLDRYQLRVRASAAQGQRQLQQAGALADVQQEWDAAGIKHAMHEKDGTITLSQIVVPEGAREGGKGTAAMEQLLAYADATGQRVVLTPSADFGGSKPRLEKFYKRLGFKPNKGRSKDFTTQEAMIRAPQQTAAQPAADAGFKAWFGDSKVVDAQGKPLVVYHGTPSSELSVFDTNRFGENGRAEGAGIYFTTDKKTADGYGQGGQTLAVYLNIRNPLAYDAPPFNPAQVRKLLKAVAEAEARETDTEWRDGFLSNFGDTYSNSMDAVVREAAQSFASEETALDQIGGIIGSGVDANTVNTALQQALGYDGYHSKGFSGAGVGGGEIWVAMKSEQVKSATANDGTFDANDPSILSQGERGTLSFADDITAAPSVISLLQGADLSTFIHESGHFFLEVQADLAMRVAAQIREGATVSDGEMQILSDFGKVLDWMGVKPTPEGSALDEWARMSLDEKRAGHEQWARGFERYAMEGKAPNLDLAQLFQRFRAWLVSVYRTLKTLNVELTDDVRAVMDRMLAADDAIAEAQAARDMGIMFQTPEQAGMTPEEYAAYQQLGERATAAAQEELTRRTLRDLKWLSRARNKAMKELQAEADGLRRQVEAEVRPEVMSQPVYRAWAFLTGKMNPVSAGEFSPENIDTMQMSGRLRTSFVKELSPEAAEVLAARRMTNDKTGIDPDILAEVFGFESGQQLVNALTLAPPPAEIVAQLVDQIMLERYGDISSPEALARAADEAVHNEYRARQIATELKAMQKASTVRESGDSLYRAGSVDVLQKAAREYASRVIGRLLVTQIRPQQYAAAEARSGKLARDTTDVAQAALHKRNQLINNQATKLAYEAEAEVKAAMRFFREKVLRGTAEKLAKVRDMDMVMAARAVLAEYGIGTRGEAAHTYLDRVAENDPQTSQVLRDMIDGLVAGAKPYDQLTVDEFRALRDGVQDLWKLSRDSKQVEIDGQKMDLEGVRLELAERLEQLGVPDRVAGEGMAVTEGERRTAMLRSFWANIRRVESWVGGKDGGAKGPFRTYIWQPIKEAAERYRADKAKFIRRYRDLLQSVDLGKFKIDAPEIGYTFGHSRGGSGKAELLHAILHTGNDSNKRKLLLGRDMLRKNPTTGKLEKTGQKWATERPDGSLDTSRWDSFVQRMINEGVLTKADFDFAQGVWDLLEETKPLAQKAHRAVFGRYFDEVTANAFQTPFGSYRGGYVPAMTDAEVVSDAKTRSLQEAENEVLAHAFPTTSKGFTKKRVEYNRELLLDLRSLSTHIDKVLLFSHMEQPVRDVRKILTGDTVAGPLNRIDPQAFDAILEPWLNRSARQIVEAPVPGTNNLLRFFSKLRARTGMAAMLGNVTNTIQQITGFTMAGVKVRPTLLAAATAQYLHSPRKMARAVAEASPYMSERMLNETSAMNDEINQILLNPNMLERGQAFTARHAYFMQSAFDNTMGPIIWTGAYNQAIEEGQTEREAVRFADSVIRETQGSTLPEDIARFEGGGPVAGNPFVRMFTQFAGYFNMQANLLGTEYANIMHGMGWRRGAARGVYVFMMGFLIPALVAEAVVQLMRGGPEDEDKDGSTLDDWIMSVLGMGTIRAALGMVPVVGPMANAAINMGNSKPYDDRISTGPGVSMLEGATRGAVVAVPRVFSSEELRGRDVRDIATLISLTTGLPANAIARPLVYLTEKSRGAVTPTSTADEVRGLITGSASADSKN